MKKDFIAFKERLAYCTGGVGKDLVYWLVTAYFMLYLGISQDVSPAFVFFLFVSGRLFDAFNDPLVGFLIDRTRTRFGKFKPWLLAGTLLNAGFTLLLFNLPSLQGAALYWYLTFIYAAWSFTYSMMDVPYWSLLATFGTSSSVRESMSATGRLGALIGAQIILFSGYMVLRRPETYEAVMQAFFYLAAGCAGAFVLSELYTVFAVRDRHVKLHLQRPRLADLPRLLLRNDALLEILLITLLQQSVIGIINTTLFFVFADSHTEAMLTEQSSIQDSYVQMLLCGAAAQAVCLISFPYLSKLTSRKVLFTISCVCMIAGFAVLCLLPGFEYSLMLGLCAYALCSCGMALCCVLTTVMLIDSADYGEFKLNMRSECIIFSVQTMSAKLGITIAYVISGLSVSAISMLPRLVSLPEMPVLTLQMALLFVVLATVGMLMFYLRSYKLSGTFFRKMLNSLALMRTPQSSASGFPVLVRYVLDQDSIMMPEECRGLSFEGVVRQLIQRLAGKHCIEDPSALLQSVLKRHKLSSCAIASGIAIPHARGSFVHRACMAMAVLPQPLPELTAPDGTQCDLIFLIASPDDGRSHLTLLGRLSLMLNDSTFVSQLRQAGSAQELYARMLQRSLELCDKQ